jgi:outer membrane protein assembly factor BamD
MIGRFYYLRQSYLASVARLQSLVDKYPLYSQADEALYLLGQDYEGQIARLRLAPACDDHGQPRGCLTEPVKSGYIGDMTKSASKAYDQIITRYPLMERSDDARKRLAALKQPIPRPTKRAVAQNRAEIASRSDTTMPQMLMGLWKKGPDVSAATKTGNPTLTDPVPVAANDVQKKEMVSVMEAVTGHKVGVEVVKPDQPSAQDAASSTAAAATPPGGSPFGQPNAGTAAAQADPNELKPTATADANELQPTDTGADPTLPPPAQVNELAQGQSSSSASAKKDDSELASDKDLSSSKKRKKGLRKIIPF